MTPIEAYIEPAGNRRGWWRILAGGALIIAFWLAGTVLVLGGYGAWHAMQVGDPDQAAAQVGLLTEGGTPARIAIVVMTFAGIWAGVLLALVLFHRQRFATIFAPDRAPRPAGFAAGLLLSAGFTLPTVLIALTIVTPTRTEIDIGTWVIWLIPLIPLIFVQAVGEELIFRGYLLQQLRLRARSAVVWAFLPSFGFGLMHFFNAPTVLGGIYYVAITTVMGLVFAVLVWRTGSLWTAAGLHVGVNTFGILVIGIDGTLSGAQIWLFSRADVEALFPVDLAVSLVMLAVLLSPLGRVFGDGRREVSDGVVD